MKKFSLITLGVLIVAQLAVPFSMIKSRENILRNGELFRFKTRPIDPADPFQGRYVRLGYENDYIPCSEDQKPDLVYKDPIYVSIETDSNGFARFTDWSRMPPVEGPFLKTRYHGRKQERNQKTKEYIYKGIRLDIPFDRFYMDEAKAPRAEVLAREATRNTDCWAEVRILDGKAVIEDVFAEGQSLRDLAAGEGE